LRTACAPVLRVVCVTVCVSPSVTQISTEQWARNLHRTLGWTPVSLVSRLFFCVANLQAGLISLHQLLPLISKARLTATAASAPAAPAPAQSVHAPPSFQPLSPPPHTRSYNYEDAYGGGVYDDYGGGYDGDDGYGGASMFVMGLPTHSHGNERASSCLLVTCCVVQ